MTDNLNYCMLLLIEATLLPHAARTTFSSESNFGELKDNLLSIEELIPAGNISEELSTRNSVIAKDCSEQLTA